MKYHSELRPIVLHEYGRNVQQMVEALLEIEDREARNEQAKVVIQIMGNLFPQLRDIQDFRHKLWVHLMEMSNFKLDVDLPFKLEDKINIPKPKLDYIDYSKHHRKEFGRLIYEMIRHLASQPDSEEREQATELVANFLKRTHHNISKDEISDDEIKQEIDIISAGRLTLKGPLYTQKQIAEQYALRQKKNGKNNAKQNRPHNHKKPNK